MNREYSALNLRSSAVLSESSVSYPDMICSNEKRRLKHLQNTAQMYRLSRIQSCERMPQPFIVTWLICPLIGQLFDWLIDGVVFYDWLTDLSSYGTGF